MYYVQHPNTTLIQALKGITEFWKLIDGDYECKFYIVLNFKHFLSFLIHFFVYIAMYGILQMMFLMLS